MKKACFRWGDAIFGLASHWLFLSLGAVLVLVVGIVSANDALDSAAPLDDPTLFQLDASQLQMVLHDGDARTFDRPPNTVVYANTLHVTPPTGVTIQEDGALWRLEGWIALMAAGSWIEMRTENESSSLGVQFWGDQNDGWARVLVDGEEVWTGDTYGASGAEPEGAFIKYLEISNLPLGPHAVRVESMGAPGVGGGTDATVYFFGIGELGVVGGDSPSEADQRDIATTVTVISGGVLGAGAAASIPYSASGISANVMMKAQLQRRRPRGWRRLMPVPAWKRTIFGTILGAISSVCLAAFFQPGGVTALSFATAIWTAAAGGGITFGLGYSMGAIWTYLRPSQEPAHR